MRYSTLLLFAALSITAFTAPIFSVVEAIKGAVLFTETDIVGYDPAKLIFELTPEKSTKIINITTYGGRHPFAIKDEKGVICRGYFYTMASSIPFTGPTIMLDQTNGNVAAPYFALRNAYPDFSTAFADKTATDSIAEVMKKANKIIDINNKSLPIKQKWSGAVKVTELDGLSVSVLSFPDSFAVNSPVIMHTLVNCNNINAVGEVSVTAKIESEKDGTTGETTVSHVKLPIKKYEFTISKINLLPPPPKPPMYSPATPTDETQTISYPKQALEEETKGTVTVKVDIRETGAVYGVSVVQSSGNDILDTSTLRGFTYWKFKPAKTNETAEKCQLTYQVEYNGTTVNVKNITPPPTPAPTPIVPANTLYAVPGEATLTLYVNYTDTTGQTFTHRIPAIPVVVE
ncbi:MAG: energy transducer TonB [bacterium]